MKALKFHAPGRPEVVNVPLPEAGEGEVRLKILGAATCPHWEMHYMSGEPMAPGLPITFPGLPGRPGHEAMGVIDSLGPGVEGFNEGDRVALWTEQGFERPGAFAEYMIARAHNILLLPEHTQPQEVASLELAMCVQSSFDQILNIFPIEGTRFGVNGLGPGGLVAVQLARAYGASEVVAFDPLESRRELALSLGADRALDPLDAEAFPQDRFSPEALDISIECTGLAPAVEYVMHRTRSVVALFGVLREDVRFGFKHWANALHLLGYGPQTRGAGERALEHVLSGKLDLSVLISETMPIEKYPEAIDLLKQKEAIKVMFVFGE